MESQLAVTWENIGIITGVLFGLGALVVSLVRLRLERRKTMVDVDESVVGTNKSALEISQMAMDQVAELRTSMDTMRVNYESKIAVLEDHIEVLTRKLEEREQQLMSIQDWAERLVYQVKSLGGVPVEIKPRCK